MMPTVDSVAAVMYSNMVGAATSSLPYFDASGAKLLGNRAAISLCLQTAVFT